MFWSRKICSDNVQEKIGSFSAPDLAVLQAKTWKIIPQKCFKKYIFVWGENNTLWLLGGYDTVVPSRRRSVIDVVEVDVHLEGGGAVCFQMKKLHLFFGTEVYVYSGSLTTNLDVSVGLRREKSYP